jgi:Holliday junction resolvasome RuvABC endonuclease subunit
MIVGIDPGKSGGIAWLDSKGLMNAAPMPKTERDVWELILNVRPECICIEKVHSMPGQGVASSFKFGQSYGFLRGISTAVGAVLEEVTPQKWMKSLGCMTRGDKNVTKQRAQQLFPWLKITHAIADATLIAEYCWRNCFYGQYRAPSNPAPQDNNATRSILVV